MKYLNTYEDFKTNESLKGVVLGTLIGLSTFVGKSQDMLDPTNPIGLTSPISPLNPNSVLYYDDDDNDAEPLINYKDSLLKELKNIKDVDPKLSQIINEVSKESFDVDSVATMLSDYCGEKGYINLQNIALNIKDIDIENIQPNQVQSTKGHLLNIIYNLKSIANKEAANEFLAWALIIVFSLFIIGIILAWILG